MHMFPKSAILEANCVGGCLADRPHTVLRNPERGNRLETL